MSAGGRRPSELHLTIGGGPSEAACALPLAGGSLLSDSWIPGADPCDRTPRRPARTAPRRWREVYRGPGLVEGALQEVRAEATAGTMRVTYADGDRYLASSSGRVARVGGPELAAARRLERALGAPLALVLASGGRYLLHASAIALPSGVIALAGETGRGKSTLAAAAADAPAFVARVADDQLPVRLGARPVALPHFPQLKLDPRLWYPPAAPAVVPLRALLLIEHSPRHRAAELRRLDPAAACLALIGATVAARLFDPPRLERHLRDAAAAAERVDVFELVYPSGAAGLAAALDRIATELSAAKARARP